MAAGGRQIPWNWVLRALVSGFLIALLLALLPAGEIWAAVRRLPPWLWAAVVALFLLGHVVAAIKWALVALHGSGLPLRAVLQAHFAGLAANLCLPGIAGGDLVRAGLVMRSSDDRVPIAFGSLIDRLLDCLALLLLACLGAWLSLDRNTAAAGPLVHLGLVLLGGILAALVVLALLLRRPPANRLLARFAEAGAACARRPIRLLACLALSLLVQAGFVGLNVLLADAAGLAAPAAGWLFAWPLAKLIAILPVSLAGLGVREASLAALMAAYGASPARVVAVGLIWQSVLFAGGLIGGLALLLARPRRPAAGEPIGVRPR
jgi:glycosyltransferase 2 family protein